MSHRRRGHGSSRHKKTQAEEAPDDWEWHPKVSKRSDSSIQSDKIARLFVGGYDGPASTASEGALRLLSEDPVVGGACGPFPEQLCGIDEIGSMFTAIVGAGDIFGVIGFGDTDSDDDIVGVSGAAEATADTTGGCPVITTQFLQDMYIGGGDSDDDSDADSSDDSNDDSNDSDNEDYIRFVAGLDSLPRDDYIVASTL